MRGGKDIGRLYLERWPSQHRIIDIAFLPTHRGQGLGAALLRDLLDEAAIAGKAVSIHVEKFNPAMRLYRRLGFKTEEDKGVYDLMRWTAAPALPARRRSREHGLIAVAALHGPIGTRNISMMRAPGARPDKWPAAATAPQAPRTAARTRRPRACSGRPIRLLQASARSCRRGPACRRVYRDAMKNHRPSMRRGPPSSPFPSPWG